MYINCRISLDLSRYIKLKMVIIRFRKICLDQDQRHTRNLNLQPSKERNLMEVRDLFSNIIYFGKISGNSQEKRRNIS